MTTYGLSLYDVLSVSPQASEEEITAAYERLKKDAHGDDLANYGLLDEEEGRKWLAQLQQAYETLRQRASRELYDKQQGWYTGSGATMAVTQEALAPLGFQAEVSHIAIPSANQRKAFTRRRFFPQIDANKLQDMVYSGDMLKRLRESAAASLEDMAEITKVNKCYLLAIEQHNFELLPAAVYIRGFVVAYARTLGLPAEDVAQSYMAIYKQHGKRLQAEKQP